MKDLVKAAGIATSKLRAVDYRKTFSFALLEVFGIDGVPASDHWIGALVPVPVMARDRRR